MFLFTILFKYIMYTFTTPIKFNPILYLHKHEPIREFVPDFLFKIEKKTFFEGTLSWQGYNSSLGLPDWWFIGEQAIWKDFFFFFFELYMSIVKMTIDMTT